jgi:hypothetical protein
MFVIEEDDGDRCPVAHSSPSHSAPELKEGTMVVNRKRLVIVGCAVLALFIIANPLGDSKHGLGKHNAFLADLGQGVWVTFLIGALVFVVLAIVGVVQYSRRARHDRA